MYKTITKESDDGLTMMSWRFYVDLKGNSHIHAQLDGYCHEERPSRRHGWRTTNRWGRLSHDSRYNTLEERPNPPQEIQAELMQDLMDSIVLEGMS